ncbi:hypothetical protein Misp01_01290 [Microtetraspora sp. NBRC 13810]|uniref:hypothetical protein n=1 Tax=Microtetraspora sp. NBRC 13810 TaxID=3030990 RepID=UPI0024A11F96|nr:hypothetical protein [Microtetraspora sp. NBRC 13810]GLW04999.1 hypothetical protein Misp01_01290 [Microtetraspora sp. NBRC 13810]
MKLEQARAVAEEYFNGVRPLDEPVQVMLYGFKGGYVAWGKEDEPDDPGVLPETAGGGCVVIDSTTGEIVIRPLLNPETVADQWPGRHPR